MLFDKIKGNDSSNDSFEFNEDEFVARKEFEKLKKLANTHQEYLNYIFIFYELEPTPFLLGMRELSYELMKFVDNVCNKYEIEYWMDYGTLLGALRHGDFVPWDDDLDVGMMRDDYNRLIEVLPGEIQQNNLTNLIADFKIDKHNKKSKRWYQISYKHPSIKGKFIGIDFFPYDYMKRYDDDVSEDINNAFRQYYHNPDMYTLDEYLDIFYDKFGLTLEEQNYIIGGIDNVRGNIRKYTMYRQVCLKKNTIFPLKRLKFGKYDFPAPNDTKSFITGIYGKNYMKIPTKIRDHGRLNKFNKKENIHELLDEGITMLKNANKNY